MTTPEPAVPSGDGGLLRVRLDISYDGGPFSGWARQPGLMTVQGVLEDALSMVLRRPLRLTVGGRTDAGVHARGQVAHADLTVEEWEGMARGRDADPSLAFRRRLTGTVNRVLSTAGPHAVDVPRGMVPPVVVRSVTVAPPGFDARFSALWRRYSYAIADPAAGQDPLRRTTTLSFPEPLDVDPMNEGAVPLLGVHDFAAFCKAREGATTIRELQRFDFVRGPDGVITATVQADAFCHTMVRALVGASLRVGTGQQAPSWPAARLARGVKDARSILAAPHPLVLERIAYPDAGDVALRAQLTRARRRPPIGTPTPPPAGVGPRHPAPPADRGGETVSGHGDL